MSATPDFRTFSLWAPVAETIDLHLDGQVLPMNRGERGWWARSAPAEVGSRYGFAVDGGQVVPDPRAGRLPDGPHGLAEIIDLRDAAWTDQDWGGIELPGSVIYELHIGTFTPQGTLDAAIGHLDQLVELGIDVIELMPVNAFPGRHGWGYDGVGLWAVHEPYGGPRGLQAFVDAAHARGLGV
ncbi:MAG: alpha-amylase family glycosyl hydrolase, partial [Micrococcales bacterium]|nr:alpha-amylase family glycosyl hydrolase [Micrococcales bacterium]